VNNHSLGLFCGFIFLAYFSFFSPLEYTAFAENVNISTPQGTSVPGCETTNECFIPFEVTVNIGDTVTWSNDDSAAHTVTSGNHVDGPLGVFDSSLFMAGTTFSHTFETVGEYPYFCMVHPWMDGLVTVIPSYKALSPSKDSSPLIPKSTPNVSINTDRTSYYMGDLITVSGNSKSDYFFAERSPASNCRVVDAFGNTLSSVSIDQQVQIACDVANTQDREQPFAYLTQIQDSDKIVVSLAWITGSLSPGQSFSPALSWIPTKSGVFGVKIFLFESVENLIPLSHSEMMFVKVETSQSLPKKPTSGTGVFRAVILEITDSFGNVVLIDQITPNSNGAFIQDYVLDRPLFKSGSYIATVYQASAKDTNFFSLTIPTKPADSDGDGIPDNSDSCPNDPKNDSDNDGVCGDVDSCPSNYGTQSNGCPEKPKEELREEAKQEPEVIDEFEDPGKPTGNGNIDSKWIVLGVVIAGIAIAAGAGLAIFKSRKSSKPKLFTTTLDSKGSKNGRECNVCGTIIPEGKNVCPNCGDTYSV